MFIAVAPIMKSLLLVVVIEAAGVVEEPALITVLTSKGFAVFAPLMPNATAEFPYELLLRVTVIVVDPLVGQTAYQVSTCVPNPLGFKLVAVAL